MRTIFYSILILFLTLSCGREQEECDTLETIKVGFGNENFEESRDDRKPANLLVCLKENAETDTLLGQIDKLKMHGNRIYAADTYLKRLHVYDLDGSFLSQVGSVGGGPGEFVALSDFCVTNGHIYIYDAVKDRILSFNHHFKYEKSYPLHFKAESFVPLESGGFLFSLAPYNTNKEVKGKKVAITDSLCNLITAKLQYEDFIDPSYEFISSLNTTDKEIVYNRPINNDVYLFSKEGTLKGKYHFDFGSLNIPNEKLKNVHKLVDSKEGDYCYLASTPVLVNDNIMGVLNKGGALYTFSYDLTEKRVQLRNLKDYSTDRINLPLALSSDHKYVISYFNQDVYEDFEKDTILSPEMKESLRGGSFIVCLYDFSPSN